MIIKLATLWVNHLVKTDIDEDDREVYLYGAECFINEAISDLMLIIGGLIIGHLPEVILWAISFTILRVNLGGYHAPTHFLCILSSTVLGLLSTCVNPLWIRFPYAAMGILGFSIIVVALIAPVLHINRPIPLPEQKKIKKRAVFIIVIEIIFIFLFHKAKFVSASFVSGLVFAVLLGIIGYFFNPKESKR